MLLRAPLALAIAIACSCTSVPTPPPAVYAAAERAPLDADAATRFLIDASVFEDVAVSIDGHESDGAHAWRVVFATDHEVLYLSPRAAAREARDSARRAAGRRSVSPGSSRAADFRDGSAG
jgi:hypothetical protein